MTELLTQDQVAELLGVTKGTLANWRTSGLGPRYFKPIGKVKYRKSDVEAFIDAGVVTSTSAAARGTSKPKKVAA